MTAIVDKFRPVFLVLISTPIFVIFGITLIYLDPVRWYALQIAPNLFEVRLWVPSNLKVRNMIRYEYSLG